MDIYATEYVFTTKYAKRELRHGEMARTDRKAGTRMSSAVNGVTSLRHSQHEEGEERELGTSMAGSVMTTSLAWKELRRRDGHLVKQMEEEEKEKRTNLHTIDVRVPLTAYLGKHSGVPRRRLKSPRILYLTGVLINRKPIYFLGLSTTWPSWAFAGNGPQLQTNVAPMSFAVYYIYYRSPTTSGALHAGHCNKAWYQISGSIDQAGGVLPGVLCAVGEDVIIVKYKSQNIRRCLPCESLIAAQPSYLGTSLS
ncbi:hypothetical protein TRIATDRAFT_84159 [Trichoderma atroviride IMI 206040]|uniref:Uncharacterized protein n=1 Tax=Hypocrea atroviridis (strain ATCC 20476 / IMI 206040) TaxID=452589 RepID=G9P559_HYPAI|nr:uncharacterized protein TRIATDRAFT_84159 [Trichoderma atroviride IMI 206040]EHK42085.1 hypothetical protein TRIATDRAFT_84159 [Trichoderma atroviride IMI 206040]